MNKLDLKVGDVVKVTKDGNYTMFINVVEKVLPNGRFKLRYEDFYWKADGTRNTHARKYDQNTAVVKGALQDYEQALAYETARRLADNSEVVKIRGEKLDLLNNILDAFGISKPEMVEKLMLRIAEMREDKKSGI